MKSSLNELNTEHKPSDLPEIHEKKDNFSLINLSNELRDYNVYIVIPAYNESKVIGNVIEELKERNYKIIIVDDGSSDDTYDVAKKSLKNYNGFVYRHSVNRGVGGALKTGIKAALRKNADIIVIFDADGQHAPDDIESLMIPIINGEADIVNGYRNFEEMPFSKKFGNQVMNIITWIFYGIQVNDSQTGFKAFDRKAAEVFEIHSRGFGVISEIMGEVKKHDLKLKEVPIKTIYTDYSMTKGTNLVVGLKILFKLILDLFRKVLS